MTTRSRPGCGSSATGGARRSITTRRSASTRGSTPSRPWSSPPSCAGSTPGTPPGGRPRRATTPSSPASPGPPPPRNEHVFPLYMIRVPRRDEVLARLRAEGIGAGIHYPTPLHLHGALRHLGYREGDFPVAERLAGEILSLPLYPHLTAGEQER